MQHYSKLELVKPHVLHLTLWLRNNKYFLSFSRADKFVVAWSLEAAILRHRLFEAIVIWELATFQPTNELIHHYLEYPQTHQGLWISNLRIKTRSMSSRHIP
jgi:hypothetical protein